MKIEELLIPNYEVHIVCNKNEAYIKAKGSTPSLLSALATLVEELKNNGIPKEIIEHSIDLAFMTDEELHKNTKESLQEILDKLFD